MRLGETLGNYILKCQCLIQMTIERSSLKLNEFLTIMMGIIYQSGTPQWISL